jgi:hypothetical protein
MPLRIVLPSGLKEVYQGTNEETEQFVLSLKSSHGHLDLGMTHEIPQYPQHFGSYQYPPQNWYTPMPGNNGILNPRTNHGNKVGGENHLLEIHLKKHTSTTSFG